MKMKPFKKVAIIGVGLMGGSLGLALKAKGIAKHVVGATRRQKTLDTALKMGAIDEGGTDLARLVEGADLVVLATPLGIMPEIARKISAFVMPSTIITDMGSTKAHLVTQLERIFRKKALYVGSHPLAGSEKQGAENALKELFAGHLCIVTKTAKTNKTAAARIEQMWKILGAHTEVMTPKRHDEVVAVVSHLPHMMAVELVNVVEPSLMKYAAGGFRDTTRIASGDPVIWKDICLTNTALIQRSLKKYITALKKLEQMITQRNATGLLKEFEKSAKKRDKISVVKTTIKRRAVIAKKVEQKKQNTRKVPKNLIVAIDGPVACGKSTVARHLAVRLGLAYLDSGALYRAIVMQAQRAKISIDDRKKLGALAKNTKLTFKLGKDKRSHVSLNGKDITASLRSRKVTAQVAQIAQIPEVRREVLKHQKALARQGVVAEGRDMCTVVFPEAHVKIYLDASLKERVGRYLEDMLDRDENIGPEEIEEEVRNRDRDDRRRKASPLTIAKDAFYIDTTTLTVDDIVERVAERCYT